MTPDLVMPAMVECPPLRSRMMEAGCVRMWRSTQDRPPQPHETRHACTTCPLGPQRAGAGAAEAMAAASAAVVEQAFGKVCPRCARPADRLINGRFCISCYNRDREARIGRNAKGTPPQIAALIHPEALAVSSPAQPPRRVSVERVISRAEAMAVAARQAGPGAIIGVPPLHLADTEAA